MDTLRHFRWRAERLSADVVTAGRGGLFLATCWLMPGGGLLQAQADSTPRRSVRLTGYAEVSYSYSTEPARRAIVGRLYDRFHDQAQLNALTLVFDLAHDPKKMSAGMHSELVLGQNASVLKSAGFELGNQGDVPQLYGTLNIPTADGNGVQVKFGRMSTLLGVEVIETTANPNWSEGNQFIYLENFTGTGLSVEHRFGERLDAQFRVFNGWDVVEDNNTRKSFMARVAIAPRANAGVALLGYYGPEQPGDSRADRYGGELLLGLRLAWRTSVWIQYDAGHEEPNAALPDPGRHAEWWGAGAWISQELSPEVTLALRGDYMNDQDGARTSGVLGFPSNTGQKLGSIAATLNLRSWEGLLLRPELRYDRSNLTPFDGKPEQVTFSLSSAYLF